MAYGAFVLPRANAARIDRPSMMSRRSTPVPVPDNVFSRQGKDVVGDLRGQARTAAFHVGAGAVTPCRSATRDVREELK